MQGAQNIAKILLLH